jgi:uncharacterized lipoprotein YmbA
MRYRVPVTVSRFDGSLGGRVTLWAQWTILGEGAKNLVLTKESLITEVVPGSDYVALAAAQSRALEKLSRDIATAFAELPLEVPK